MRRPGIAPWRYNERKESSLVQWGGDPGEDGLAEARMRLIQGSAARLRSYPQAREPERELTMAKDHAVARRRMRYDAGPGGRRPRR
jgi:hypothetical protein